jgi:hypothetical protein
MECEDLSPFATENRRIIGVQGVGLLYWLCDELAIMVFEHQNIFSISFTSFNILIELYPATTLVL